MNTKAELLQAEAGVVQAGRDVLVAQQQLSTALGFNQFNALVVTGTWTVPQAPDPHPDFDSLVERVPAVKVQESVLEQAKVGINIAESSLLPTLSLAYSRGRSGDTELPTDPYWTFSGALRYPLLLAD